MYYSKASLLTLALAMFTTGIVFAQAPAYAITRWTVGSSGGSSGGGYMLNAIAGQPENTTPLTGGMYTLARSYRPSFNLVGTLGEPGCREGTQCVFLPLVAGGQ